MTVTRIRPWPARFGVRNLGWRSLFGLLRAGSRRLAEERFDAVFFSTTQFICLPLGRWWKFRFGVPFAITTPSLHERHAYLKSSSSRKNSRAGV